MSNDEIAKEHDIISTLLGPASHQSPDDAAPEVLPLPRVYCKSCETDVIPTGRGQCPKGHFIAMNFVAAKKVDRRRLAHILADFIADYQPTSPIEKEWCATLASVIEQTKHLRIGSAEHARAISLSHELHQALSTARDARAIIDVPTTIDPAATIQKCERIIGMCRNLLGEPAPPISAAMAAGNRKELETTVQIAKLPEPPDFSGTPTVEVPENPPPEPPDSSGTPKVEVPENLPPEPLPEDPPVSEPGALDAATAEMLESLRRQKLGYR